MKLGIVTEFEGRHKEYINACEDLNVNYEVIDLIHSDWINNVKRSQCDGFLIRPSSSNNVRKSLYDERIYFLNKVMGYPVYPSYNEIFIYENKRNMAYWLDINDIPSPKTWVFYNKKEALNFIDSYDSFPLVFKPNIGSASMGIKIMKFREAKNVIGKMFTKWRFFNRGVTKWYKSRYKISYPLMDDKQYNNILFQERINIKYEWRGIKIGESYFAHKKLEGKDGLHSGSGRANYENPPNEVMDFIKHVCDIGNFNSMNVDFFEDTLGDYYVNELQTMFGSEIKPYQMCVDGNPGRYINIDNKWQFEEGSFNENNSSNLRVKNFLKILNHKKSND